MTTPQVIQWTHVDDQAPPFGVALLGFSKRYGWLLLGWIDRDVFNDDQVYQIDCGDESDEITHWAIIAPPEVKK